MKHFNLKTKSVKSLFLLLALLLGGTSPTWAQKALPYSYGFEDNNLATDGWTTVNKKTNTTISTEAKKSGSYGFLFYYDTSKDQYLVSPELTGATSDGISVSFAYRNYSSSYPEKFQVGYSTTTNDPTSEAFTWDEVVTLPGDTQWYTYNHSFTAAVKYIAIKYIHQDTYKLYVDDISINKNIVGPGLAVADGTTNLTTGHSYNFGLATSSDTKTFTLSNPGTESITLNIDATNGFGVSPANVTIAAKGEETLTVTMADATASGTVTITPVENVDPFTINVSGTIRDLNKVYLDFADGNLPDGWSWVATGSYASSYPCSVSEGYISWSQYGGSSYAWAFTSPKLNFEKDELIAFETARYGSSTYYSPSITVEYSLDGTTWTAIGSAFTDDVYGTWTKRSVTIPVEGVKYIRFNGWYIHMRNIYGGEVPNEPKMVVTQPTTLAFGAADKDATAPTKTFTIANTGLATLEGINVTSGNAAFTISNAPATLAAGESQEVTITMATATVGNLSSEITVSATGYTGDDAVKFTVTGTVMPTGLSVIDFNDNQLPARWENTGWTFSNGAAYAKYNTPAYVMTTPKIVVNAGDMFVIKGKIEYNSSSYYVTVKGLNSNSEEVYSRKLTNDVFNNTDFTATLLSDVPATVEKLQFVGYYGYIDEIQGINYAAALSVTTGDPAAEVSTPANYDFGECAADATVTYNFANAGAGTINITNVAITGDGAAAYSTNWTESVAAPFDLTITRTYNAERTTAQAAVVTVTTSEGDFVINVTGTDKAANAPELAVLLGDADVTTGASADFGTNLQAAPAAKTYTIKNTGTGTLTGTIATSDDTQFTVSKTEFSLGADQSTTFDLALVFNTTYGAKAATITIHPTNDGLSDIVINATASTLDPEAWTEDFAAGTLPTGWVASSWTVGTFSSYENTTSMALAPSGATAGTLITPRLSAKAGDVLSWDGYFNWYNEAMTVEYSSDDQVTWTKIYDAYKAEEDFGSTRYTHKAMSFTAPADGNYYLRFTSTYQNGVDNFVGFKLNIPDHIMAITASSIPTSGSYSPTMKATKSFTATVTVKESRGVAETGVVAKVYMGTTVIGTSESTDFEANESKMINITATPTEAATEGVQMHIEVEYAGGTLSTTPETRYVAEFVKLELTEAEEKEITTGYSAVYDQVTLTRSFAAGWNTFIAPQVVNVSEFGEGAKVYSFTGYEGGALKFSIVTSTSLNSATPYVVYVPSAISEKVFTWDSPVIYSSYVGTDNIKTTHGEATFQGTYAPIAAGDMTGKWGVTSDGHIKKAGANASIKGFRAYFDLPAGAAAPSISFEDTTTGITSLTPALSEGEGAVYNLNGQKVQNAQKGLYIVNGKKVVIK